MKTIGLLPLHFEDAQNKKFTIHHIDFFEKLNINQNDRIEIIEICNDNLKPTTQSFIAKIKEIRANNACNKVEIRLTSIKKQPTQIVREFKI